MVKLDDILDVDALNQMRDDGYIRQAKHPTLPLVSECYTKQTMFQRAWTHETRTCRGLIWNTETLEVVARPFAKFFNYGEPSCPELKPTTRVLAFDKLDGSLGIWYNTPSGPAIATKNSFLSPQAAHATSLLRDKYDSWEAPYGTTALFEIIYKDNRIVLDYGDVDDLFLLGIVNIQTGVSWGHAGIEITGHPFPTPSLLGIGPLSEILESPFSYRENREGMVLKVSSQDIRVKVKQEDYLELHKVATGLNKKALWTMLSEGKGINEILMGIPEELHDWATPIMEGICHNYTELDLYVAEQWMLIEHMGLNTDRKKLSEVMSQFPPWLSYALWFQFDGDYDRYNRFLWKQVKPSG